MTPFLLQSFKKGVTIKIEMKPSMFEMLLGIPVDDASPTGNDNSTRSSYQTEQIDLQQKPFKAIISKVNYRFCISQARKESPKATEMLGNEKLFLTYQREEYNERNICLEVLEC